MAIPGAHGSCPACRAALWAPDSELVGQRTCPRCGAGLWVLLFSRGPVFVPRRPGESLGELLIALGGPDLGTCDGELDSLLSGADHLDVVELLWELEEGLRERGR